METDNRRVAWVLAMGAPPARDVGKLVELAQSDGWEVCLFASPAGRGFLDVDVLDKKTGHPVRSEYSEPGTSSGTPAPDVIIAAPITCNSLAKWATGISDTLPLGILVSAGHPDGCHALLEPNPTQSSRRPGGDPEAVRLGRHDAGRRRGLPTT